MFDKNPMTCRHRLSWFLVMHSRDDNDPWLQLHAEFDLWEAKQQRASLWWRDDDAVAPGVKLSQLVELTSNAGLLLAVIPVNAQDSLAKELSRYPHVKVAQHGFAHINHAPRGQGLGAWELGLHRGEDAVLSDLATGRARLNALFGPTFIPVIVPPWNRIAPELLAPIASLGYQGVSAFGPREASSRPDGLIIANAHCDPIRWKSGATFAGEQKTITQLVEHLAARRCGRADVDEHTGFCTHHINLDSAGWKFCAQLASVIDAHAGAQWVSPTAVFGELA